MSPPPPPPAHCAGSPGEPSAARWFQEEVHPHDASLKAYLHGSFPSVRDVDDVVQESYLRLLRVRAVQPIRSAKAFLFQVARHVVLDLLRRGKGSPVTGVGNLAELPVLEDRPDVAETVSTNERVGLLAEALITLPPVCRKVVMLRKLKGLSRQETATELGISEKTVDVHLSRGLKKLEGKLSAQGVRGLYDT